MFHLDKVKDFPNVKQLTKFYTQNHKKLDLEAI